MLSHNAVVVVADGHSATLYRNVAQSGIELSQTGRVTPTDLADQSPGNGPTDASPRDEDEATFAIQLADHLNKMVLQHKIEEIAIIADPSTLGVLRQHYHKELQLRLRREVAKTLTNSDLRAIENALS